MIFTGDISVLIEKDLGPPSRLVGLRPYWLCPFHTEHRPSLTVTPDRYFFKCFGCGKSGDAITWLCEYRELSFSQACRAVGKNNLKHDNKQPPKSAFAAPNVIPPSVAWQERARVFVTYAQDKLWEKAGGIGLNYLHQRGLSDDTIRAWGLGWCSQAFWDEPRKWGLEGKSIWLPQGIVIPCKANGTVWYVKTRRFRDGKPLVDADEKYGQIRAGNNKGILYGIDHITGKQTIVICEGELDAPLLWQEVGDLVDVVAIGGKENKPSISFLAELAGAPRWLVALDCDADKAAKWWLDFSPRAKRVRPLQGNDLTDFHQAGGSLRAWIVYHLNRE